MGTASSHSRAVAPGNAPFELRVIVTSDGVSAYPEEHYIPVVPG